MLFSNSSRASSEFTRESACPSRLEWLTGYGVRNIAKDLNWLRKDLRLAGWNKADVGPSDFNGVDFWLDPFRTFVVATRPGNLSLGPATLAFHLPVRSRLGLFGNELMSVKLISPKLDLEVLPLPAEGVPEGFAGAVGQFTMTVEVSTNSVVAGDPILITVEIGGEGPIESLQLNLGGTWDGFKTYAPETAVTLQDKVGLQGSKRFSQVVIPQSAEVKELPTILFSYFDPVRQSYQVLAQAPVAITVRPGAPAAVYAGKANGDAETFGPKETAREIVHIKNRLGNFGILQPPLVLRPWFMGLNAAPVLAWLALRLWQWRQAKLARNPKLVRRRHVARLVREGLAGLQQAANRDDPEAFFAIVFQLLQERLGEKAGMPASSIDELNLDQVLEGGADDQLRADVRALFQDCSAGRYAPGRLNEGLASMVPRIRSVLNRLEEVEIR